MKKYILGLALLVSINCSFLPKPQPPVTTCSACDLYTNPETVRICKAKYCAISTPTRTPNITPVPTGIPSANIPSPVGTAPWYTACSLPTAQPAPENCIKTTPGQVGKFRKVVDQAMQNVFNKYPSLFYNKGTQSCPWSVPTNAKVQQYIWNVQLEIVAIYPGFCTIFDGENINVKIDNDYEEEYHPLRTDGDFPPSQCVSDINGIYAFHCAPATF